MKSKKKRPNNMELNKGKRTIISLETKLAIIDRLEKGEEFRALRKEYGLGDSTMRAIKRRANEIYEASDCASNKSTKRACYSRNILIVRTEKALKSWIQELVHKQIPVDGEMVKKEGKRLYNHLRDSEPSLYRTAKTNFAASYTWLSRFLQRHGLHNVIMNCSKMGLGSCPDKVINTDETTLLKENRKILPASSENTAVKRMCDKPEETASDFKAVMKMSDKPEETASGFKAVKFIVCSDASGEIDLKPLEFKDEPVMIGDNINYAKNDADERDESVSNSDTINCATNPNDDLGENGCMTEKDIYAGLQLCNKLESHFLSIDTSSERTLKFQNALRSCMAGYRDLYSRQIKQQSSMTEDKIYTGLQLCDRLEHHFLSHDANFGRTVKFENELQSCMADYRDIYQQLTQQRKSQKLITANIEMPNMSTPIKCELVSSSNASDFKPGLHKKLQVLDYEE